MAGIERWADEATRQFLSERAANDEHSSVRVKALGLLVGVERWADDATRQLLTQRAFNDEAATPRAKALELLADDERWADDVKAFMHSEHSGDIRGCAACQWFGSAQSTDPLKEAKKLVFSRDVDGINPFLDPREPVSDEHLAKVAKNAKLDGEQLDEMVEQLAEMVEQMNETLGWDIRNGWPGTTDSNG